MTTARTASEIPAEDSADRRQGAADPAAMPLEQLARLLGVEAEVIRRHVEAGAPASPDGRINLVHYAAWLNKQLVATEPEAKTDGD
jgi:hypothetical protein